MASSLTHAVLPVTDLANRFNMANHGNMLPFCEKRKSHGSSSQVFVGQMLASSFLLQSFLGARIATAGQDPGNTLLDKRRGRMSDLV